MPAPTPSPSGPGSVPDGEATLNEPARIKRHSREPDAHTHQQKRSAWITLLKDELMSGLRSLITSWAIKYFVGAVLLNVALKDLLILILDFVVLKNYQSSGMNLLGHVP